MIFRSFINIINEGKQNSNCIMNIISLVNKIWNNDDYNYIKSATINSFFKSGITFNMDGSVYLKFSFPDALNEIDLIFNNFINDLNK